jgi:hypothetical protein
MKLKADVYQAQRKSSFVKCSANSHDTLGQITRRLQYCTVRKYTARHPFTQKYIK